MSMIIRRMAMALPALALAWIASAAEVQSGQTISLVQGWNAVYITVTPGESADELFAGWPVDQVSQYNPASYLETRQYSGSDSIEGVTRSSYLVWRRGQPELSSLKSVVANNIYVCYATNAWSGSFFGRPAAPRITWHPSAADEPMNLVGFSLADSTTLEGYFNGLDVGNVTYSAVIGGGDPEHYSLSPVSGDRVFQPGEVVVMTASKVSDWSGVLNVSPLSGLDFSTNQTYQTLSVRNDGALPRTVRFKLGSGVAARGFDVPPLPEEGFMLRDLSVVTNGWIAFTPSAPFTKRLAAGETAELALALDRTKLKGTAGTYYGGLLTVADDDGGSNMRVTLPVELVCDGGANAEFAWPKGLWLASATLDKVSFVRATDDSVVNPPVKAGGEMNVRLPLYVEADGTMKLLQRVLFGSDTNGNSHVYSAATEDDFPVAIGNVKRISSAMLPIDDPVIGAADGAFGTEATFAFTVSENSRVNPFRHAYHPSHDGLQWDFETAAPSGDNVTNYVSTVKPEIFSVRNRITFKWNESQGCAWDPEEQLSGELEWALGGVRHEGDIRMKGSFTMKRISAVTIDR